MGFACYSTWALLPNVLYFIISDIYPDAESYDSGHGWPAYKVPCHAPHGNFDYTFGNVTIKVSLKDSLYKDPKFDICTFGFTLGPQDEGKIPLYSPPRLYAVHT